MAKSSDIKEIDWYSESIQELDENSPLIRSDSHSIQNIDDITHIRKLWFFRSIRQYVLIEVVVFLYFLSVVTSVSITQFFLFDKIAERYPGYNISAMHPCQMIKPMYGNMTDKDVPKKIERETTMMMLYLNMATAFPAVIPTVFLGGLSDRYGRKVVLLIAITGSLFRAIVYIIVINFRLNIHYLFIGNALEGLSGSFGTCLMAMFSLIADITEPGPKRAVRITALEAMLAIASAAGLLIAGYWVGARGYFEPMTFATCLLGIAFIFTSICIPETLQVENKTPFSLKIFKNCVQLYTKDTVNHRRWKLIICLISFFLVISIGLSKVSLTTLYLLDTPFCWPQTKINLYYATTVLVNWIAILIFIKWCGQRMSERMPAILGCASYFGSLVLLGIAVKDVYVYASAAVGMIGNVISPVLRSIMSHQVSPFEQGILFASVGVIELSCTAIMGIAATLIYNLTIGIFSGLVFLCMAGLVFIVFVMLVILNIGMNRQAGSSVIRTIHIKS